MKKLYTLQLCLSLIAVALHGTAFLLPDVAYAAGGEMGKGESHRKLADEFFNGPIVSIEVTMTAEQFERLKRDARNYAEATVKENGRTYKNVAVKLKGAAGSFQGVDAKPGFTLSFDKFKGAERFHGLKKFHLNNGAQDGTFLNEQIAGEMARRAGVVASRCTHAFVKLNGRDLGLYVVKEAYTKDMIGRFFRDGSGDLYDGGFCKEIEENMEKDTGDPEVKEGLRELIAACKEPDAAKRWERLGQILDIDRFVSFAAMEAILCHWDGYNFNRNNYRIYQDTTTGKFSFFLHGMDQMFGDANSPLIRDFSTLVGGAVMRCPEGSKMYRGRLESIYANVLKSTDWPARVDESGQKVRAALEARNPQWAKDYANRVREARDRVEARVTVVGKQLGDLPRPFEFDQAGIAKLEKGWREENGGGARIDRATVDGKPCLHIAADGQTSASWRFPVVLDPGKYRFEAQVKSAGVAASSDQSGKGAGLRISGGQRTNAIDGDSPWKVLSYEFETPGGEVRLVAELRATRGEAWFDALRLVRLK